MYPESRFLSFHGMLLHYRVFQPEARIAHRALLVPSPGLSTRCWRFIVPELLRANCLCVTCDLPGYGLSTPGTEAPQAQDVRARLLWGALDEIDLQLGGSLSCWNLMGHGSAAGTVATMAVQQPDSAASLTLISPLLRAPYPAALRPLIRSNLGNRLLRSWYTRNLCSRTRIRGVANRVYGTRVPTSELEALRKPLARAGMAESVPRLLLEGYEVDTRAFSKLFLPEMVLWGGRDRLLGGSIPKWLREALPSAEYHTLRTAGHCAMETHSRAVCDYLRGWIREMW